ncbi:protein kinase [Striga asiatica]|uniref:Protein kinase n=1 Tax=Striga asiatica TaxID=4170 RepID=A0A5A7PGF4_STRAF|nr:protein kinase [Striga asiatica]
MEWDNAQTIGDALSHSFQNMFFLFQFQALLKLLALTALNFIVWDNNNCKGLMSIHRMKIAHRDLKSANCLVNKHWTVKICDFGLSRVLTTQPMKDTSSAGTPEWMAPELIRNEPFTKKCDIFSLGVIMWELCTLSRPWEGVPSVQIAGLNQMNGRAVRMFFLVCKSVNICCADDSEWFSL